MMKLFEAVPDNLFTILASRNKELYADALDVLYAAYGESLRIPEDDLYQRLCDSLDKQLVDADFDDDDIKEEERNDISGKARFLIRHLAERGWFERERASDFRIYLTVPGYSSMLMGIFHRLREDAPSRGYSLVFGTYSILKVADEKYDAFEKMSAVYSAYENTQTLIKMLQQVYHDVRHYYGLLLKMSDESRILALHYDDFGQAVIEKRLYPLKIKDSVPKFRVPIQAVLKKWRDDDKLMSAMAESALADKRADTADLCRWDLIDKIENVINRYDTIERAYLDEIDSEVRRYTSATAHKIESLTNRERDIAGNINYLLKALVNDVDDDLPKKISPVFRLYEQSYISSASLYSRKSPMERAAAEPLRIREVSVDRSAREAAAALVKSKFSRSAINEYIERWLRGRDTCTSQEMDIPDDRAYVMSLLAVLTGGEKTAHHTVDLAGDGEVVKDTGYQLPEYVLKRKGSGKRGMAKRYGAEG